METFYALLALCEGNSLVAGEFLSQRPLTRSFDVFFDLRLNKQSSKLSWGWLFEKPSCPLWRHCNVFTREIFASQMMWLIIEMLRTCIKWHSGKLVLFMSVFCCCISWHKYCMPSTPYLQNWKNSPLTEFSNEDSKKNILIQILWKVEVILVDHYSSVRMSAMASQITGVSIVYSTVCSGADQRKHPSSALAFLRGIHQWRVNSPHKGPVTRKTNPFDDVIM